MTLRATLVVVAVTVVTVGCGPAGTERDADLFTDAGPPTWPTIYADYFGPSSVPSCGMNSGCHDSLTAIGGIASNFVCVDQAGCYASLTGLSHLVRPQDTSAPAGAPLFRALRQADGRGRMPSGSTYTFRGVDIARMQAWIAMGAPSD